MTTATIGTHPAKYSKGFDAIFAEILRDTRSVLDPMAGVCGLANIRQHGYTGFIACNELEPEWAMQGLGRADLVTMHDAEHLPFADGSFEAICTSPTYGNRMADHHNARDDSRRNTYTHVLGRRLSPGNTGAMQWGTEYKFKHTQIWRECGRVLAPGGLLILNVSDHIRKGAVAPVTDWHVWWLTFLGFALIEHRRVPTLRNRFGANRKARVECESILVFRK